MGRFSPVSGYQVLFHTSASNWQLSFLNQQKGENDCRNDFVISIHESYVAKLGFKLATHHRQSDAITVSSLYLFP